MIQDDQVRALNLKVLIMKSLVNNIEIDAEMVKTYLQLDGIEDALAQMDAFFKMATEIYADNNIKQLAENINFKDIFRSIAPESDEKVFDFFVNFLKAYVEDDIDNPIADRLDKFLEIDCEFVSNNSEVKRLYLYLSLLLALSSSPIDLKLVEDLNAKLQETL